MDGAAGLGRDVAAFVYGTANHVHDAAEGFLANRNHDRCAGVGGTHGGAVGNVIDRLRFGAVVDFIHAHVWGWSWYVFNVADAAIVCGVAALVLDGMRKNPTADDSAGRDLAGADGQR